MSTAARARRRAQQRSITELVAQAHNHLQHDAVADAHELIHEALGVKNETAPGRRVAPLTHRAGFDEAFRNLCNRFDVAASYVLVDTVTAAGTARLLAGGNAALCAHLGALLHDDHHPQ
ncbi:MAG: hypothetical protein FD127_4079 [Acidimicrobiaceae bacterium]|nr:MAG: hypothetical protein FD127_4079 [Acidimicrobiaceae bacterium]